MKDRTVAQKMRIASGVLYLLLSVFQMFAVNTIITNTGVFSASFVWVAAVLIVPIAGAMSVWMFSGDNVFNVGARRGVVVATIIFIVFEWITYSQQAEVINFTFSMIKWMRPLYNNVGAQYGFVLARQLLMLFGAFCFTCCRDSMDYKSSKPDDSVAAAKAATEDKPKAATDLDKPLDVPKKDEAKEETSEEK